MARGEKGCSEYTHADRDNGRKSNYACHQKADHADLYHGQSQAHQTPSRFAARLTKGNGYVEFGLWLRSHDRHGWANDFRHGKSNQAIVAKRHGARALTF